MAANRGYVLAKTVDLVCEYESNLVRRDSTVPNMFAVGPVRGLWALNWLELGKEVA